MGKKGGGKQLMGGRRAGAVDIGELDNEIVDRLNFLNHCSSPCLNCIERLRDFVVTRVRSGMDRPDHRLLHVPRTGRTALRAQTAVQAHVLILDHDPAGSQ